ncbi:MAG: hypothetical protein PHV30_01820 [Candidatus Margulisbacteria bacterium]|nr:hypothetical protein [Candidatus Margulisiibacteriota bacterium]
MFTKIIAEIKVAHLNGKIDPHKYIKILTEKRDDGGMDLIITPKTTEGLAEGKALVASLKKLLETIDLADCDRVVINCAHKGDLQFLTMYLAATPEIAPVHWFGQNAANKGMQRKLQINILSKDAFLSIPDLISNCLNNQFGTLQTIASPFHSETTFCVKLPADQIRELISSFEQRLDNAAKRLAELFPQLVKQGHFQRYAAEMKEFIDKYCVFNALPGRSITITEENLRNITTNLIKELKTFHIETDETTHIFVDDNEINIVDAGNPLTPLLINELKISAPDLKDLNIMITHGHKDHTSYLKATIEAAVKKGLKVNVYLPIETLKQQFFGIFVTDIEFFTKFKDKINFYNMEYVVMLQPVKSLHRFLDNNAELYAVNSSNYPAIKHFIDSFGYVHSNGSKSRIFTGDINPQFGQPLDVTLADLKKYLDDLVTLAKFKKGIKHIDIFMDFGHFKMPGVEQGVRDFLAEYMEALRADTDNSGITFNIYLDHIKNNDCFIPCVDGKSF